MTKSFKMSLLPMTIRLGYLNFDEDSKGQKRRKYLVVEKIV